jgi:hypothetical protein
MSVFSLYQKYLPFAMLMAQSGSKPRRKANALSEREWARRKTRQRMAKISRRNNR